MRMDFAETARHIENMLRIYDRVKDIFEEDVSLILGAEPEIAHDVVRMAMIFHDVGKFTPEYIGDVAGYDHSSQSVVRAFFRKYCISPARGVGWRGDVNRIVASIIQYHHELRRNRGQRAIAPSEFYIDSLVDLSRRYVNSFRVVDRRCNVVIGYLGSDAVAVLNIVTLIDNIEANLSRGGDLTRLAREYLTNSTYQYVFEVAEEVVGGVGG